MPLVVPALRLAMLFLNIYDSYKVLKPPPTSSRHANKPSLRAVTQRKRNIKGCLAVWMVWENQCCYILYERLLERLVSLFIPFYDELKSLVILFLMLTRARGAEPIYLHMIRPFLKPYTETLDNVLDFMSVIADIALALVGVPFKSLLGIWNRRFGRGVGPSDDAQTDHLQSDTREYNPHDMSSRKAPEARSHIPRPTAIHRTDSGGSSRSIPRENGYSIPAPGREETEMAQKHEIWYPPPSAYGGDDEDDVGEPNHHRTTISSSVDSEITLVSVEQVDEWRLYPQFPSAYPPTPLVTLTRLSSNLDADARINGSTLPRIDEVSSQGFRLSLSPPLDAMNPGSFGGLSDERPSSGIREMKEDDDRTMSDVRDVSMADNASLDEDEEDEFNITLQTPVPVRVINKTLYHASKMTSRTTSLATTMSGRSLSTGLSTVDNGSSLRTKSSLDSLSSVAASSGEDSPVIGKKRRLPASSKVNNRNHKAVIDSGLDPAMANEYIGDERHGERHAPIMHSYTTQKSDDGNVMFEKKRRVASPNRIAVRTSKTVRHVRSRPVRASSPPARTQRPRLERKPGTGQAKSIPQTRTSALRTERWIHGAANSGVVVSKSIPRDIDTPRGEGS